MSTPDFLLFLAFFLAFSDILLLAVLSCCSFGCLLSPVRQGVTLLGDAQCGQAVKKGTRFEPGIASCGIYSHIFFLRQFPSLISGPKYNGGILQVYVGS